MATSYCYVSFFNIATYFKEVGLVNQNFGNQKLVILFLPYNITNIFNSYG